MMDNVSLNSGINRVWNVVGIIFLIIAALPLLGSFYESKETMFRIFVILFIVFLLMALLMMTYKATIIITHDQYLVRHRMLGLNINNRTDIRGWKTIRLSARSPYTSGNLHSVRRFELDLSPAVGKEWTFSDVLISGHFSYDFDEDPVVVANMLIDLQKVTGFNVELDKSSELKFGVTYRTLKIERRV
jgi:hypothetical protein